MNFQIMQQAEGRKFIPVLDELTNKPLFYANSKVAAAAAKALSAKLGVKCQPRLIAEKADWRQREIKRFLSGEYMPVLWAGEKWWKEIPDHYAHVGVKDKGRIAFTSDAEKGEADRQTAMLPGKYLQQFFGDVLTKDQVREFAMQHATKFEPNEIKWAKTPEEIEHVYKVGPSGSCFKGTTQANLYGSGDFAVAYIEDADGKITARAICAIERKIYPYIYGDAHRMRAVLEKNGFKCSTNGQDYTGLKLVKKLMWRGWYPDWYPHSDTKADPDNKEFLLIK